MSAGDPQLPVSNKAKWKKLRQILLDPTVILSVILGTVGAFQSQTQLLTMLLEKYPVAFGWVMAGIAAFAAMIQTLRIALTTPTDAT